MEAPQEVLRRAQRRRKRCCISTAVAAATVVLLAIVIPCALLLSDIQPGPTQPAAILLPLYIYPSRNAWEPLFNAVSTNQEVNFTVIVNPDSGPGQSAGPGNDYVSAISRLTAAPNVQTVGYVRTGYGTRDIDTVLRDVDIYSRWSQLANGLAVSGIFFDEAPHDYSQQKQQYMATANQAVKESTGIREPRLIIHNPGTIPDATLDVDSTDVTVVFENSFQEFERKKEALRALSGDRPDYSVMVHSVPTGESIGKLLRDMSREAKYMFLTTADEGYYDHFSSSWATFVDLMRS
ncbi:uncharacterized protein LTR77_004681 [Saxophila tyrrhenica]|uniref:Uncharacterized protein n=1 Tax=Saxophila tyrrhenica TaxID=1690608 RepID=A0AAV9P9T8_9PEZI|nr:hypothetical protein LTR77_004681 [Saxophila tyrrhenica]